MRTVTKWDKLYAHERYFAAMHNAGPELYAAAVEFLERYDHGLTADTDYIADLMRKPVEEVRAALSKAHHTGG